MDSPNEKALGFDFQLAKNGRLLIYRNGELLSTLRASKAATLFEKLSPANFEEQQQILARFTGNYKRGNERQAKNHPRNR